MRCGWPAIRALTYSKIYISKIDRFYDIINFINNMSLNSLNLEAFKAASQTQSFSKAAKRLHLTQSALSQRIQKLEDEMGRAVFIRRPSGLVLTDAGERLLRYCQIKDSLETELLGELHQEAAGSPSGVVRIAAYSSVLRSVILPSLSNYFREHANVQLEFVPEKVTEIPKLLKRAEVDFGILDYRLNTPGIVEEIIGKETYVAIESTQFHSPTDIYLDLNPDDPATEKFFRHQKGRFPKYRRSYLGDVYGIIDGVSQGLGRAIMPKHLLSEKMPVRSIPGYRQLELEVCLHYYEQPYYSELQMAVIRELKKTAASFLS
ncbi:MAG: hypothetical protein COV44_04530 [Deltaproteobacteria bacterium CG11_big_fil_rev_8_21_14_0_20_45_16]|nr:MAG: hypothetical protein COV44_04530 [Deltaproteobacteria bacterium CG11_big_fil_rev_8_21_14_0_20_45_16]